MITFLLLIIICIYAYLYHNREFSKHWVATQDSRDLLNLSLPDDIMHEVGLAAERVFFTDMDVVRIMSNVITNYDINIPPSSVEYETIYLEHVIIRLPYVIAQPTLSDVSKWIAKQVVKELKAHGLYNQAFNQIINRSYCKIAWDSEASWRRKESDGLLIKLKVARVLKNKEEEND